MKHLHFCILPPSPRNEKFTSPSVFDGDWFESKEPFESELTKLKPPASFKLKHDKFGLRQKERKPIKKLKLRRGKERHRKYVSVELERI